MKTVTAILLGAGGRGTTYADYALDYPHEIKFVAVAEPDRGRREKFRKEHGIDESNCFESWEELLDKLRMADAALICTQDWMHFKPAMIALEKGYHVLLEKPMSNDPYECIKLGEQASLHKRAFLICHVLRYTPFFRTLKGLLEEGRIGRLISIQHNENVGYWHQAHSFVRGNWRNSGKTSPMILAKSCHDMDILLWLAGADCRDISSFGALTHFKAENAPEGAPKRCLDGCPAERECPYYAPRVYIGTDIAWLPLAISNDTSVEGLLKALREGPYGRCVYHCDNDVVDHQVVNMEFENEVTASFTMCAFTRECDRTIKLMGTEGEIRGHMEKNEIEVLNFKTGYREVIHLESAGSGHGGGDYGIMRDFVSLVREDKSSKGLTSADISVQSHVMAFAAERSRLEKQVININEFMQELQNKE